MGPAPNSSVQSLAHLLPTVDSQSRARRWQNIRTALVSCLVFAVLYVVKITGKVAEVQKASLRFVGVCIPPPAQLSIQTTVAALPQLPGSQEKPPRNATDERRLERKKKYIYIMFSNKDITFSNLDIKQKYPIPIIVIKEDC